ncbi:MAG: methionine aminotransferase [Edaphocola sp.]
MLQPKFPAHGTTIFTVMSALANEHKAINLSQGFPDFNIDPALGALVQEAIAQGHNQYAPMAGLPALRQAIAGQMQARYGIAVDADTEITITPGATYALYAAFTAVLQPGDEVLVPEPCYDSYVPNIYTNGAQPVYVPMNPADFSIDWAAMAAAVTPRTKAIVVNNPHNPCGSILRHEDFVQLEVLACTYGLYVIADEVYEHLVYDGKKHLSVLAYPALRQRSFVVFSFGKTLHATGWKLGYCIAAAPLTVAFRQLHQFLAFSVNTPMQHALANYLQHANLYESTTLLMEEKRDFFIEAMRQTPFGQLQPSAGSYFQLMSYEGISDLPDREFSIWLTKEHGVATIPLSPFYHKPPNMKLVRFCFAKKEETLLAAADRLKNV